MNNTCPSCGAPLAGKFCGKCGAPVAPHASAVAGTSCPSCGKPLAPGAKFCGGCGAKSVVDTSPGQIRVVGKTGNEMLRGSKLVWSLEPQVIAMRLDEDKMASFTGARGIVIREGTRALIFSDGKLLGEFTEGEYDFRDALSDNRTILGGGIRLLPSVATQPAQNSGTQPTPTEEPVRVGGIMGSLRGLADWAGRLVFGEKVSVDEARRRADQQEAERVLRKAAPGSAPKSDLVAESFLAAVHAKKAIAVVLARSDDFHLLFTYQGVQAADLRTDVGVDVLMRVRDLTDFYRDFLMDTHILTSKGLANRLGPILDLEVAEAVREVRVGELEQNRQLLDSLGLRITRELDRTMPSLKVSRVFKVTGQRQEIERLNQLREKLYLSDKELSVLQAQNEFANRLRMEETQQQVRNVRSDVELEQNLRKINKDKILGDAEFAQWLERVKLDRDLASARTQEEREAAIHELQKKGFLREEDMQLLQGQSELRVGHTLGLMEMRQELESRRLRLEVDSEMDAKELDLELDRNRRKFLAEYELTGLSGHTEQLKLEQEIKRQGTSDAYGDQRRDIERVQKGKDLDLDRAEQLKQLEVVKQAQELLQARRKQEHEQELEQLRVVKGAEKELLEAEAQRWAGMTVDQIMAANPDISPDAAKALAERGRSVQAEEFARKQAEMAQQSKDEFKDMMRQQQEMQERMMRSMMESNAAIAGGQIRQKDVEVERALSSADKSEERIGRVVSSTAGTFTGKMGGATPKHRHCSKCGVQLVGDADFCAECGHKN